MGKGEMWNPAIREMQYKMEKVSLMRNLTRDQIRDAKDIDSILRKKHPGQEFQQGRRTAMRMSINRGISFSRKVFIAKNEFIDISPKKLTHFPDIEETK